ncbi:MULTISPECIES: hypothetical protein [Aeromonas]|jgi:predicted permease|uniref:hypothetical protein n=1 Tax=Aeromonas TaxID=642 RepID=UPI0022E3C18D|nr:MULTISPECIES: hypothetical protein [Aeromonas]
MEAVSIVIVFVLCFMVGIYANKKGRSAALWTILSLFISPLISVVIVACLTDLRKIEEKREAEERREREHKEMMAAIFSSRNVSVGVTLEKSDDR